MDTVSLDNKKKFEIEYIHINKIFRNKSNKYSLEGIEELSENINETTLLHNVTVLATTIKDPGIDIEGRDLTNINDNDEVYKLISGERRCKALRLLYEKGEFDGNVPCKVLSGLDSIEQDLALISGNKYTRTNTQEDIFFQIERMEYLLTQKAKKLGKKTSITNTISKMTGHSARTVDRYRKANKGLIKELKEMFNKEEISITEADTYSGWDPSIQLNFYKKINETKTISKEELKKLKDKNNALNKSLKKKESELKILKNDIASLEKDKDILLENIQNNKNEINSYKTREEEIKSEIIEKEKEKNSEALKMLNDELDGLVIKLTDLKNKNGELSSKLRESNYLLEKRSDELQIIKDEQRSLKYENDLADENTIVRKTLKRVNVKRAFEMKEEIIHIVNKIYELEHLEPEQFNLIYDDLKSYIKILKH